MTGPASTDAKNRMEKPSTTGVVLAGGQSRRMGGTNKALLKVGGLTVIERIVNTLSGIFSELLLITNTPEEYRFLHLPMVSDLRPGYGALGGLYTGLKLGRSSRAFLFACDMPFLNKGIIRSMTEVTTACDVIIPRVSGMLEPLHAIYSTRCIPHIEDLMADGDLKIINLFPNVNVHEIPEEDLRQFDPELRFIMNVNTPADLAEARDYAGLND